jgi:ABC-type proline/glycine betaine transport system permease subunit
VAGGRRARGVGATILFGRLAFLVPLVALACVALAAAARADGWPVFLPSLGMALGAAALAAPIALAAAVGVEVAPPGAITKATGRALAGIGLLPSPVLALPALLLFGRGGNGVAAVFTALMVGALPSASRAARAAVAELAAVRGEVGLVLGATPGRTLAALVLPAAVPMVAAGAVRGASRALGLCAPILVLGVELPLLPLQLMDGPQGVRASAALTLLLAALALEVLAVGLGRRAR